MIDQNERRPNNISRVAVKALLFNHLLQKGIQDEETLYGYIKEFLGFTIPTESVCTHHVAPWKSIVDIFFERKDSTFLFGCVAGSTRVYGPAFPEGLPIKSLVGKNPFVYTYNFKKGRIGVEKALNIRKTASKVRVLQVTLDDYRYLRVTPDHKFLLRNLTWKRADQLKPGDSLMPFYRRLDNTGYARVNHKVVSVTECLNPEDVYDMEVPETSCYVAEGVVIHNSRSSGKTRLLSILNHVESTFKPGISICNAGAIISQAQKNYEYTLSYYEDDLLASTLKSSIQSKTVLENGSEVKIMSSSLTALNGEHPCKFRLDEIELIDWSAIQEGFSMTQSVGQWKAQDTLSSTRKFGFGSVQRLLDEAEQRNITVYPWCIWESVQECTRLCHNDPVYGNCPIYSRKDIKTGREVTLCGGKAHSGQGFYPIPDLIKKIQLMDHNTFRAQWECAVVGDASTVYGSFYHEEVHLQKTEEEFQAKFLELEGEPINPRHQRVTGIDFGGNFAIVRLVRSPSNKRRFYILEVYFNKKDVVLDHHIKHIKKMRWFGQGHEIFFGDTAARQDIIEFNSKGIPVRPALKDNVFVGINLIKSLLEIQDDGQPGIIINAVSCPALIQEFISYAYKITRSGLPDSDSIVKANDHCLDALRYALDSLLRGPSRMRSRKRGNF